MEEMVYTILYKKELLSEEENSYHFTPCYIVKGLYDEEENVFLDEINKSRYLISDPRTILENCEYAVGEIYTEKELKKKYPNAVSFEQIEIDMFKETEKYMTIGIYNKQKNKINIKKYSYDGLTEKEEIDIKTDENVQRFDYNKIKSEIGMDFSLFTSEQVDAILNMDNIDKIHQYVNQIKNSKDKYPQIVSSNLEEKHICLADNIVDYLIESEEIEQVKNIFIYYNSIDVTTLEPVEEYEDEQYEEYEEEIANIFNGEEFENISKDTIVKLRQATTIEEVKDCLNNICEFYKNNMTILEMIRESGYNFFKTYHYFLSQLNYINELLKLNNMNQIKREYILLYIKNKNTIKSVINELEYDVEKTEIQKSYQQTTEELNQLVGLDNVKKIINDIFSSIMFKYKTNQVLNFEKNNKHMVFTGNPGTGKTTVAEIIAPLFYKLGYLETDKVAFVAAEDLIAGYIGQTAIKTKELIQKNRGGIIVIDEAYILSSPAQQFGNEAITVILKEMEKNRTMFIFAGYKKEMEDFIKMNSGLKSRVNTYVQFDDYSEKELLTMFMNRVKRVNKNNNSKDKLNLSVKTVKKIRNIIKEGMKQKDFGNGRFVKNIFDITMMNHAKNTKQITDGMKLYQITEEDIPDDILEKVLFGEEHNNYSNTTMGFNAKIKSKH